MTLYFGDMQGLQIECAGFTETVRFAEINFADTPKGMVSYQLARKLLLLLYKNVKFKTGSSYRYL